MKIFNADKLSAFVASHASASSAVRAWRDTVEAARWQNPADIKATFRSADPRPRDRWIFNIGGNNYRLIVVVVYNKGAVWVRWIGTHAEYDRIDVDEV